MKLKIMIMYEINWENNVSDIKKVKEIIKSNIIINNKINKNILSILDNINYNEYLYLFENIDDNIKKLIDTKDENLSEFLKLYKKSILRNNDIKYLHDI
jgi:hypothetical protein